METITTSFALAIIAAFIWNVLEWRSRGGRFFYHPRTGFWRAAFGVWGVVVVAASLLYFLRMVPTSLSVLAGAFYGFAHFLYSIYQRRHTQHRRV